MSANRTTPAPARQTPLSAQNSLLYNYGQPLPTRSSRQPLAPVKTGRPRSQVSHCFSPGAHRFQDVVPVSFPELLAKIDCEHPPGQRFFVSSRQSKSARGNYQTTVMDESTRIFYRALHETGVASLLKGVRKRRAGQVVVLRPTDSYQRPEPQQGGRTEEAAAEVSPAAS